MVSVAVYGPAERATDQNQDAIFYSAANAMKHESFNKFSIKIGVTYTPELY